MTKRVLVFGGTGFIGSKVCAHLANTGWAEPVAVSRNSNRGFEGEYTHLTCNLSDEKSVMSVLKDADAIVNCTTGNASSIIANSKVLAACLVNSNKQLIHLSSQAVYGSAQGTVTEDDSLLGDLDPYSHAKAHAEEILSTNSNTIFLRPGIVYGPGGNQWTTAIGHLLKAKRLGDLGSHGDGVCNLVYVDDVAEAVTSALKLDVNNPCAFNLSNVESFTWNDYLCEYALALNAVPIKRVGDLRLKLESKVFSFTLKAVEKIIGTYNFQRLSLPYAIRPSFISLCQQNLALDSSRATKDLNINWTENKIGIKKSADWFNQLFK